MTIRQSSVRVAQGKMLIRLHYELQMSEWWVKVGSKQSPLRLAACVVGQEVISRRVYGSDLSSQ